MAFAAGQKRSPAKRKTPDLPSKNSRLGHIYQTAAKLIHDQGYEATSLNDIAKAAGLTKAGLYHYVSSKESLLYATMNYGMDLVESDVLTPARLVSEPVERLRTLLRAYANLVMTERQAITIVINEAQGLGKARRAAIRKRRHVFQDFVRETIEKVKDDHGLPKQDIGITTQCFVGSLVWLTYWYSPQGRLTKEEVSSEIEQLLVDRLVGVGLAPLNRRNRS